MSNGLVSLVVVAILAIAAGLAGGRESCCDDECNTVKTAKDRIREVLASKYGLSESEATELANKLMSGDSTKATEAAKKITEIGAFDDIFNILTATSTQKTD